MDNLDIIMDNLDKEATDVEQTTFSEGQVADIEALREPPAACGASAPYISAAPQRCWHNKRRPAADEGQGAKRPPPGHPHTPSEQPVA